MTAAKKKIVNSSPARTVTATTVSAAVATTPVAQVKVTSKAKAKPLAKKPVSVANTAVMPVARAVLKTPVKPVAKPVTTPKAEKPVKAKKPKLVRDSFTIPKAEYAVLDELKQRAGKLASAVKKSELIRAGIKALAAMPDAVFLAALKAVPAIKTGRPAKD